jgi:hypothetical protein
MPRPIAITIPHQLGQAEARRRLETGFASLRQQMTGGLPAFVSFTERWDADRLTFEGGALGQKITGRLDVLPDAVRIELDLPQILAAIADRITGRLQTEAQQLLEKK